MGPERKYNRRMSLTARTLASLILLSAAACQRAAPPAPAPAVAATSPRAAAAELSAQVDRYWESFLALNPSIASAAGDRRFDARLENSVSLQYLADSLDLERSALNALAAINAGALDGKSRLDYEIFKLGREQAVSGYLYPQELLPVNQLEGMPQRMARMAAGDGGHAFSDTHGYEAWLARIDDYSAWTDQAIANLREGARRGYLLPQVVVERLLPPLALWSQGGADASFLRPLQHFPKNVNAADQARLTTALTDAVGKKLQPAYRRLHDFLHEEYLPRARASISLAALPNGTAWYEWRVRQATGTRLTPAQAHAESLAEVQRLRARLADLAAQSGFEGNLPGFTAFITQDPRFRMASAAEWMDAFKSVHAQAAAAVAPLFAALPQAEVQLRAWADARSIDAPAAWFDHAAEGAPLLVINTAGWQQRLRVTAPAVYLAQGLPGRYLQDSLQRGQAQLPSFRRFGHEPGFEQGWAAYAQALGEEAGVYADPYARIGMVLEQLRHAVLAVADTGIHSKGWTRQQALEYVQGQMPIDAVNAAAGVDGCIAEPARALSAVIGGVSLRNIRQRAQAAMGASFDLKAFHAELLGQGAMPLELLEAKMDRWSRTKVYNPAP
jgi:uncharacterized protein (DUF885 family)